MSDKSLPKPVLPKDPKNNSQPVNPQPNQNKIDSGSKMPPSARVTQPPAVTKPSQTPPAPQSNQPLTPPKEDSQSSKSGADEKPVSLPPSAMKPPVGMTPPGMGKPPSFPTQPPQSTPPGSKPVLGVNPAAPQSNSELKKEEPTAKENPLKETPSSAPAADKKKPSFANVKESPFKYLPFLIGGVVLIAIVWFVISKLTGSKNTAIETPTTNQAPAARKTVPAEQASITYWGLWEPDNAVRSILDKFEAANPGVKVNYVKQSHKDFRERLQTAISSGNGPDVFRYHASWTPMLAEELASMPQSVMSASVYQQTFYPIAAKMLNIEGQIVGIPLMYEGLGLYYNKEMLIAANSTPPSTWAEVKTLANKLTVREGDSLKRGGIAIGNASNVEHFADILGLLMLQNGADPVDPSSKEAQDALSFYTNFVTEDKVWDDKLPSSTVAFARGDAAMMLAPSWRAHEVQTMSPDLDFGIVPVPRLGDERLAWASFWAEGVSSKSKNKEMSWALLKFLSSKEIQQELYSSQSKIRSFGEIYSRVDLANELAGNELVAPYLEDAPAAAGWYLSSYTHDNGVNDLLIKYYEDAVNAVLGGTTTQEALETVFQGTKQVLRQYGVE